MKIIIINILLSFLFFSCSNNTEQGTDIKADETSGTARIQFAQTSHDFGKVIQGEQVGWYFDYENTGDAPLIIKRASASCGCTVPEYDKHPVPPGGKGKIKVVYDSRGRSGKDFKTVTIETNAENRIIKLKLTAEVLNK